jgi:hypothetical protein
MDEAVGVGMGPAERAHHAGADGPTPTPGHRRRMSSARRKQEAVLRLLRGEVSLTRWSRHPGKVGSYAALAMCS